MESRIIPRPESIVSKSSRLARQSNSNIFRLESAINIDVNTEALVLVYSFLNIFQPIAMKVPCPMLPISPNTMSSSTSEPQHQILFRAPYSEDIFVLQVRYMNGGTHNGAVKNGVSISCSVELPESYPEIGSISMRLDAGAIIVE